MSKISTIKARQILDSRGNPTIEVDVFLESGALGRAAVPSGASTGEYEAHEMRDGNTEYLGKGVLTAIDNIHSVIQPTLKGMKSNDTQRIDQTMIDLDGSENKSRLGANAILGVSLASAHAAANDNKIPFFEFLGENSGNQFTLPVPMMNILNGGQHADNKVDIQEFMVFPFGAESFSHALRMGTEIFHHLKMELKNRNLSTTVGDEGGFAPDLKSNEEAIQIIIKAVTNAGYSAGNDVFLALDVAASELYNRESGKYYLESEKETYSSDEMIAYLTELTSRYPIVSIEDGLDENDWSGWSKLQNTIGSSVQIVGDDLTVTNPKKLNKAINEKAMNAILVKLNQIGTLSETLQTISMAKNVGFGAVISHRSGETEDTTIADLSVAAGMGQIKTGALSRTDRTAKYNQLLRIEEQLGDNAVFANKSVLGCN
tara:strand:- start:1683 stop:2972 length:1290 start_codon:yes stop_codon:yes gene_type:complete